MKYLLIIIFLMGCSLYPNRPHACNIYPTGSLYCTGKMDSEGNIIKNPVQKGSFWKDERLEDSPSWIKELYKY